MKNWLNRLFWSCACWLLRLRYKVTIDGGEALKTLRGPTLVLPNHPAYVDPALVLSHLRLARPLRPLVFSGTYRIWLLRPLMSLVDAFEVPDLSAQSRDAQTKTLEMIDSVVARLERGDCFLIYPSGRLQRGNREVIGAARATQEILARCPNANVVLVRTRGVWGSMFSCAETGGLPNLARRARSAIGWLLASLIFFLPRRRVSMHVEVISRAQLPTASRDNLNAFLENWYNADGDQEPIFVRYHHWWGPDSGKFQAGGIGQQVDVASLNPKTVRLVNELIQSHLDRHLCDEELQAATTLESIGLDSLDRMDLALRIEQQFGFRSSAVASTLGQLWALADGKLQQGPTAPAKAPDAWIATETNKQPPQILAETIAAAFVRRALAELDNVAAADGLSGVLKYRRMLVGSTLMSKRFKELPQQHIGVMLPASIAADIVFFAAHLAGKVPVMMNWTTGPAHLAHGAKVTDVKHIVTSRKMIDRLGIEVAGTQYVYLEDLRSQIGKGEGLWTLAATHLFPGSFLRNLPQQSPDEPAVYLFTSGSESLPKTVPLSHRNLLTNVSDGLEILGADATDALLGFLPPFHSFGLTGNVLLPHVAGIRTVRYPDPTDARGLVHTIAAYRPSMVFTTPTFLGYMLSVCRGDELHSLRKIITGAEKCPESIFERCAELAPNAQILEGYGITECSPVVAANPYGQARQGSVGKPVKSVEVCVVDLESNVRVQQGETGMLLVTGPSIFAGYHAHDGASPFVMLEGKSWYKTGDLVSMDSDGYIHFQGRLKRFLKAGGEMISLPALEEPFLKLFPADENGPRVAVEGIETPDGRHITLFTTFEYTLREASALLHAAGLRGVMRLDEVRQISAIPVLGTGKTDYKQLRQALVD